MDSLRRLRVLRRSVRLVGYVRLMWVWSWVVVAQGVAWRAWMRMVARVGFMV